MANDIVLQAGGNPIVVSTAVNFTQNDLITVAVSKAETTMQAKSKAAMTHIASLEKRINAAKDEITKLLCDAANAACKEGYDALAEALKKLGAVSTSIIKYDEKDDGIDVWVEVKVRGNDSYYSPKTPTKSLPIPDGVAKLKAEIKEKEEELAKAREEAVTWRRKLAQIPTLERKYRAQLVEKEMNKTEGGRDLLAGIGAEFEQDIMMLPG